MSSSLWTRKRIRSCSSSASIQGWSRRFLWRRQTVGQQRVVTCRLLCTSPGDLNGSCTACTFQRCVPPAEIKFDVDGRFEQLRTFGFIGMFDLVTGPFLALIMERLHVATIRGSHDIWKITRVALLPCTASSKGQATPEQLKTEQAQLRALVRFYDQ